MLHHDVRARHRLPHLVAGDGAAQLHGALQSQSLDILAQGACQAAVTAQHQFGIDLRREGAHAREGLDELARTFLLDQAADEEE